MKKFACSLFSICMILGVFSGCRKDCHESVQVSTRTATEVATEVSAAATTELATVLTTEAIETHTEPPTEAATKLEPTEPSGISGVIKKVPKAEAVNVRERAGMDYKVVLQLKVGTEITVYEVVTVDGGTEWGRIDQGWICMDYVQLNGSKTADKLK